MKKTLLAALAAMMSLQAAPALAENYEVNLTRKGSNVYKIDGKDIIIQTRYCYVYAYSEEAIFKTSGYGGEVIFFDSKDTRSLSISTCWRATTKASPLRWGPPSPNNSLCARSTWLMPATARPGVINTAAPTRCSRRSAVQ